MATISLFEYFHSFRLKEQNRSSTVSIVEDTVQPAQDLETIFFHAKQCLESALDKKDFLYCCEAIELFKKAAYLPRARTYYVEEILNKTKIPLLQYNRYTQEMLEDPKVFIERCFINEHHFYRYFVKLNHRNKSLLANKDSQGTIIPFPIKTKTGSKDKTG